MKITPAMRRCLEAVQSLNKPAHHHHVKSWPLSVQLRTWARCHDAGLMERSYMLDGDDGTEDHNESRQIIYIGSALTDAGRKALED